MANPDYILANKPSGVTSHRVSPEKPGFCEWLENKLVHKLYIVQRLDKDTSGCMILATSSEAAARLTEKFTARQVKKKYLFITDRKPKENAWFVDSEILKDGKAMTSKLDSTSPNSRTEFRVVKNQGRFYLVEASPTTGKTHQIRLHAQDSKIPLLGDTDYGGTAFPHFFLHSHSVSTDDGELSYTCPLPLIYDNLDLLLRPQLCQWLMSYDRRMRLYPELFEGNQCLRLIHNEGTPLRADKLGDTVHAGWWDERAPTSAELADISRFFELIGVKKWSLQNYKKQKNQDSNVVASNASPTWRAVENGAAYEFRHDVGSSPGLFLDQRLQRLWVRENAKGKKVLNLFAYTAGFSVMAALGGAESVVTVDLYKKYIEWSKENFRLNNLAPEKYKFYDMDSQEYLKYALKKDLRFDLIVCDPPSFSRNKSQTFQIDRDYKSLLQKIKAVLSPNGVILFSTNFEQWDGLTWERAIASFCQIEGIEFTRVLNWQWDFEVDPSVSLMKAFQIRH